MFGVSFEDVLRNRPVISFLSGGILLPDWQSGFCFGWGMTMVRLYAGSVRIIAAGIAGVAGSVVLAAVSRREETAGPFLS